MDSWSYTRRRHQEENRPPMVLIDPAAKQSDAVARTVRLLPLGGGWTASTAGSGNRAARHFCAIHGYGEDATLKGFTNWEITGGELRHNFLRFRLIFIHFFGVCKFLNGESRLPI
ncbi:unnamed protein product [Xylocopa violacea]|uniref:Uncharacterized protein n=1 Tax=Xylocopa violacea TaxID=135666 RepID=A0ABP1NR22_XYLVO